jgi:hypothetical protein
MTVIECTRCDLALIYEFEVEDGFYEAYWPDIYGGEEDDDITV